MKKAILTFALATVATVGAMAQVSVGAGYVGEKQTSAVTIGNSTTTTPNSLGGFYVEGSYSYDLGQGLSVAGGLKGVFYGDKDETTALGITTTKKSNEFYLVLPVDAQYSYTFTPAVRVFGFAGPRFALGLSSKTKVTYSVSDDVTTVDHYGEDSEYGRFNMYLGAGIGVDLLNMVRVKVGYDIGLLNRSSADNTKINDAQWYVGVAYLF